MGRHISDERAVGIGVASMHFRRSGYRIHSGRRARPAVIAVAVLAFGILAASCDSGSSNSATPTSTATASEAAAQPATPTGAEAGVAQYMSSQGIEYAGDCATTQLPRDKGKWCSTLVEGADSNDKKVYGVGPVGEKPTKMITLTRHGSAQLTPGLQVGVADGNVGSPEQLTPQQLAGDLFITGNLILDQQAGIGNGLADLPGGEPGTGGQTGTGGTGGGTGTPPEVISQPGTGTGQYPPAADIVVDDPNVEVGGIAVFRGSGCATNEPLQVLFDGGPIGAISADPQGTFAGSISIPLGTAPGPHTVTVRGASCVFNTTITVRGGSLAFTGSTSHTGTYVLGAFAAIVLGLVLIVGTRRRKGVLQ